MIPKRNQRKLPTIAMITSITLIINPCFMYFTTNAVFIFINNGTKNTNDASAAASLSWLGTMLVVGIIEQKGYK